MLQPDPLLEKAREFTNDEVTCLTAWIKAYTAGDPVQAEKILQTGLLPEHYRSLLTEFGEQAVPVTDAQIGTLTVLRDAAKAARDAGGYG